MGFFLVHWLNWDIISFNSQYFLKVQDAICNFCNWVLVFAGLTAYDTQKIKNMYYDGSGQEGKKAIMGALTLYLDFINLFIMLIQLFGQRR